ncbi:MAG: ABC transporter substrate-binding protein [Anaerolineae bacterium]|nr:ABC transporter substrate-binding protein [Anaerolineae bacterium]
MKMKLLHGLGLGLMLISLLALAACSTPAAAPAEKPTLVVINWKDYGSDNPEAIKQFEAANNCTVVHEYMASEEELLTKIRTSPAGKIDVILPNAAILPQAIKDGLLAEIDTSKVSNFPKIYKKFLDLPENKKDGKYYALPWVWGSTAIAYNTNKVTEPITSMSVLWDEKYKGHVGMRDDFNDAIMSAAIVLKQDPNNPADLEAIKQKLIEQKPLNQTYWKTGDEWSKFFANEQIWVGLMWSGQAASMKKEGQPIAFVVPEDGAIGWVDNWAVVKGTNNYDLALKFIDFMISDSFQKTWVESGGPAPVNSTVGDALSEDFKKDAAISETDLNRLYFISYHDEAVKKAWNELWQEVKAK